MKITKQYHLTDREVEFLKAVEGNGGLAENRGVAEGAIFKQFGDVVFYMTNEGSLISDVEDAWHWTIELTENGRQALAKHPQPHTVEIEMTMVSHEAEQ